MYSQSSKPLFYASLSITLETLLFSSHHSYIHDFHYDLHPDGSSIFISSPDFHLQIQTKLSRYLRIISAWVTMITSKSICPKLSSFFST